MTQQPGSHGDRQPRRNTSKQSKQAQPRKQTKPIKQVKPTKQVKELKPAKPKAPSQEHRYPEDWPHPPLLEHVYPVDPERPGAFASINQAVCSMVDRFTGGQAQPRVVHDGYVAYDKVRLPGVESRISVIQATPSLVFVQLHVTALDTQRFPQERITDRGVYALAWLLDQLDTQVERYLRAGFHAGDYAPPVPDTADWPAVFEWQRIYHPRMTEAQLGEVVHMGAQSVANKRSEVMASRRHPYTPAEAERIMTQVIKEYERAVRRGQQCPDSDQRVPRGRPRSERT